MTPPSPRRACWRFLQGFLGLIIAAAAHAETPAPRPNIVFILADDLGYGDVQCLNPEGKIKTPHIDAVAAEGMKFTDAHTSSAVCPPTRYGVLTGRYNWRSRLQSGVLGGLSPPLIEPGRLTVEAPVHHSINGSFAIRRGNWKLELCAGSGGWSAPPPGSAEEKALPADQLYDLSADLGEQRNVAAEHPELVAELTKLLESYVANGRSTPGAPQANPGRVKMRKGLRTPLACDGFDAA